MQTPEKLSFFEFSEDLDSGKSLWSKHPYLFPDPGQILLKADFHTKKKAGKIKIRSLILTKTQIFLTKVTQFQQISGYFVPVMMKNKVSFRVMELFLVRMSHTNNSKMIATLNKAIKTPILFNYSLKFTKYNDEFEIMTNDFPLFQLWKKTLANFVIQNSFHEDFNVIKMIGKGSFAKVYLSQKREDSQFYAVKAFSKENLMNKANKGKVLFFIFIVVFSKKIFLLRNMTIYYVFSIFFPRLR